MKLMDLYVDVKTWRKLMKKCEVVQDKLEDTEKYHTKVRSNRKVVPTIAKIRQKWTKSGGFD